MAKVAGPRGAMVALALIAGLFAMHGLTQHTDHLPAAATTTHAAHAAPDLLLAAGAGDPAAESQDHDGSGALALCLTVLAAAWLALRASGRPRGGVLRTLSPAVTATARPLVRARAPDPPGRWALSVCRC